MKGASIILVLACLSAAMATFHHPSSPSLVEVDMDLLESQWKVVQHAAHNWWGGSSAPEKSDEEKRMEEGGLTVSIPPPEGAHKYGTPRNYRAEVNDSHAAKSVCSCMVNELLWGLTKGVLPYRPNWCNGNCYEFDAGVHGTPLWYKQTGGQWYWTPSKPSWSNARYNTSGWQRTSSFDAPTRFWRAAQWVGLTDVLDENKFMMRLIEDYDPHALRHAPQGSDKDNMDSKHDLAVCMARKHVTSQESQCSVKQSGCMSNIVTRYFQYVEVHAQSLKKHEDRKRLFLDFISIGLDLLGLTEPFGFVFDLLSAGLSFARKHYLEACLSLLAAIPAVGQWFTAAKVGAKLAKRIKIIDTILPFFKTLAAQAKTALSQTKLWFKSLGKHLGFVTKFVKGAKTITKQWKGIFDAGVTAFQAKPGVKTVKSIVRNSKKVFMDKFRHVLDGLCMSKRFFSPTGMISFMGKILEWTGAPFGLKETGEWMIAVSPCLEYRCDKKGSLFYLCMLHMGFESFKKVMAIADPEGLEAMGEYDPNVFLQEGDVTDETMNAAAEAAKTELTDKEMCEINIVMDEEDEHTGGVYADLPEFVAPPGGVTPVFDGSDEGFNMEREHGDTFIFSADEGALLETSAKQHKHHAINHAKTEKYQHPYVDRDDALYTWEDIMGEPKKIL